MRRGSACSQQRMHSPSATTRAARRAFGTARAGRALRRASEGPERALFWVLAAARGRRAPAGASAEPIMWGGGHVAVLRNRALRVSRRQKCRRHLANHLGGFPARTLAVSLVLPGASYALAGLEMAAPITPDDVVAAIRLLADWKGSSRQVRDRRSAGSRQLQFDAPTAVIDVMSISAARAFDSELPAFLLSIN